MITIISKNNLADELAIVESVQTLCQQYEIPEFTTTVLVEKGAIPHSHPILTLNTRNKDSKLILKTLIHEQFHWYAQEHPNYERAISYLKAGYKDDGEHNKSGIYPNSYWEHIIVCFNTRNYLNNLLPKEDVLWLYDQWQAYPTLERLILDNFATYQSELDKFGLVYNGD